MSRTTAGDGRCPHGGFAQDKCCVELQDRRRIGLSRSHIGLGRIALGAMLVLLVLAVPAGGSAQAMGSSTVVGSAGAGGGTTQTHPAARIACVRDVPAVIHGKHKCLGPGEYCSRAYEREYERYGFVCSTSYDPPRLRRG